MTDILRSNRIKTFFVCLLILILPILLCFCESSEDYVTEIRSAKITNNRNNVKVELTLSPSDVEAHKGEKLYLVSSFSYKYYIGF